MEEKPTFNYQFHQQPTLTQEVREQSTYNQPQNPQPHQKVQMDGWIQELIPEVETYFFDETSWIRSQDRLLGSGQGVFPQSSYRSLMVQSEEMGAV